MSHVSRIHKVALDWLFDRINFDPKIQIIHIDTKNQLADILTKGNSTRDEWNHLLCLFSLVKDDSGACAVFTEQGSSASRMTAAQVMDLIARLPDCTGQAAEAVSAYTQVKMEDAPKLLNIPKSECPDFWIRLPRHKWPIFWSNIEDPVCPPDRKFYGHPFAGLLWERQFEEVLLEIRWEKSTELEMFVCSPKTRMVFVVVRGWSLNCWDEAEYGSCVEEIDWKCWSCTQRECKPNEALFFIIIQKMFEPRISATATEKIPGREKPHAKTVAWSYDMEGHAKKCVVRGIVNWQTKRRSNCAQFHSTLAWMITTSRRRNLNQSDNYPMYVVKGSWNACIPLEPVDVTFFGP